MSNDKVSCTPNQLFALLVKLQKRVVDLERAVYLSSIPDEVMGTIEFSLMESNHLYNSATDIEIAEELLTWLEDNPDEID